MSKNKDNIKSYCYRNDCNGPVVRTGFQEQYNVCKICREEITDRLAQEIKDREKDKKNGKEVSEIDLADMWNTHYGKLPDGNDDGFY